ncbi:MAG: hypothetical protein P0Y53_12940 [Candidatus Pseudobacter hemicellulosilyticus]|uniref:Uncharacterized protein n=1 Tax=Candidatus Pseudobacter hemicellulosilyticus TaxID=3121375 RepID=A0AAJ6BI38_9BACT|nr:MAG: hypothetical protein P0Y53_12940 [Pseudobacter sp.]
MKTGSSIRSLLSGLCLLLLMVSMAPPHALHQLLADHEHAYELPISNEQEQVSSAAIHCHCFQLLQQQVLYVPAQEQPQQAVPPRSRQQLITEETSYLHSAPRYLFKLQGPPAC